MAEVSASAGNCDWLRTNNLQESVSILSHWRLCIPHIQNVWTEREESVAFRSPALASAAWQAKTRGKWTLAGAESARRENVWWALEGGHIYTVLLGYSVTSITAIMAT